MERRNFIKTTIIAGAALSFSGALKNVKAQGTYMQDIGYNSLPKWRGFNLQEKFTHKPDEWMNIAPEWGFKNEPFRESDFALIK